MVPFLVYCTSVRSQDVIYSSDSNRVVVKPKINYLKPKPPAPIIHEMSGGVRLNTDGWSVFTNIGKAKAQDLRKVDMFHSLRLIQIEVSEKKNPKEEKIHSTTVNTMGGSSTYIFGKINNFYTLKLGYGYSKMIAGKPDEGCVSIHWSNVVGFALGFLKPYYLNLYSDPQGVKYNPDNQTDFLNQDAIMGSAGFSKGLSEMQFIPGGHIKSAIHFDFSTNKKNVLGVEAGVNFEYYSQEIQLMANQPATPYFADMYVSFEFGRRW